MKIHRDILVYDYTVCGNVRSSAETPILDGVHFDDFVRMYAEVRKKAPNNRGFFNFIETRLPSKSF